MIYGYIDFHTIDEVLNHIFNNEFAKQIIETIDIVFEN